MLSPSDFQLYCFLEHIPSHCQPFLCQIHCFTSCSTILTWSINNTWLLDCFFLLKILFFQLTLGTTPLLVFPSTLLTNPFQFLWQSPSPFFDLSISSVSCSILRTCLFSLSSLPGWSHSGLWLCAVQFPISSLTQTPSLNSRLCMYTQCLTHPHLGIWKAWKWKWSSLIMSDFLGHHGL